MHAFLSTGTWVPEAGLDFQDVADHDFLSIASQIVSKDDYAVDTGKRPEQMHDCLTDEMHYLSSELVRYAPGAYLWRQ